LAKSHWGIARFFEVSDMAGFDVTGWDRRGKVLFQMGVEAPNDVVAVLYATGHLRRTPDGLKAVIKADKVEAHAVARRARKYFVKLGKHGGARRSDAAEDR